RRSNRGLDLCVGCHGQLRFYFDGGDRDRSGRALADQRPVARPGAWRAGQAGGAIAPPFVQTHSRLTATTARVSPGCSRVLLICCTVPSITASSTFSICIASTTATVSPALTSCPSLTAIETTSPGIGHTTCLPVSPVFLSGISRA